MQKQRMKPVMMQLPAPGSMLFVSEPECPLRLLPGDALRQLIRNERRIELAYEEHRYHDARRWMIPASTIGRGIKAINVTAKLKSGAAANVLTNLTNLNTHSIRIPWKTIHLTKLANGSTKCISRVISKDEISRNAKLTQNPGY